MRSRRVTRRNFFGFQAAADRHLPDAALRVDGRWVQPAARPPPRPPAPRPPPVQRPRKPTENERQRHRSEATPHDDEQAALLALYYRYKSVALKP